MKFRNAIFRALAIALPALSVRAEDDARVEFAFGVLSEMRQDGGAVDHFEKARLADPTTLPLVRRAVAGKMAEGDRQGAVQLYRDLAAARPDDLEAQLLYADFLDEQAHGDSLALRLSDETLEAALEKFPALPELIRRLHQHALVAGNRERQVKWIESIAGNDADSLRLYAALSAQTFAGDELAEASRKVRDRYLAASSRHPEDRQLATAATEYFTNSKLPADAIAVLRKHLEVSPSSVELQVRLGVLLLSTGDGPQGEAELKKALAINPRLALAHQALAKYDRSHDQPEQARFHAGELLKLRGGSSEEFANLADEWLAAGDVRQARLLLERAVFDHPDDYSLASKLAIASHRDPATRALAARLFREAEACRPAATKPAPAFLLESADSALDMGQTKVAEEQLRTAIRAFPPEAKKETAAALRRLAGIWEAENRNGDAARALRQRADALER